MRLTEPQIEAIRAGVTGHFGQTAKVWLFGSRVDDHSAGGDIDLFIEPEIQDPDRLIDAKLLFLLELHRKLGDRKIDVIIRRADFCDDLPIYLIARETGVPLQ